MYIHHSKGAENSTTDALSHMSMLCILLILLIWKKLLRIRKTMKHYCNLKIQKLSSLDFRLVPLRSSISYSVMLLLDFLDFMSRRIIDKRIFLAFDN